MDLLLHPRVKSEINDYIARPAHALIIAGPAGGGKGALAEFIARATLGEDDISKYPYFLRIEPVGGSISIEAIRELQGYMALKTLGKKNIRRLIIIEYADKLTIEAQNAFLKLLEEPPADTVIIMTVNDLKALLPTLQSRARSITVTAAAISDLKDYLVKLGHPTSEIDRALGLSEGQIGLTRAILDAEGKHPMVEAINVAKKILVATPFERLNYIDELSKQKEQLPEVLEALRRISRVMLKQSGAKGDKLGTQSWHRRLAKILKAQDNLNKNAQARLLLTNLFINL